jgi:hypothetical protein
VRESYILTSTVTVTQAGTVPTLSVSPKTLSFPANASRLPVQITSNATTTLTSEQDWLDGPSGFGDRTVEVFANTNPTGNTRTGKVIVRTGSLRDTIQVSQAPQPPSVYGTLNGFFDQPGGTTTLTIESNSDWKITNPGEWFTFSTLSGRGNATVSVTAPANGSVYPKRVQLTITAGEAGGATVASEPVEVYQYGLPVVFEVSPAPGVVYWGAEAQSSSFTITTNADWTATSDRPWLSVSPAAGTGTSTVTFSAPAHTGSPSRSTLVRIALPGLEQYKSFQVLQLPSYVSPTAVDFAAGGGSKTVQVNYTGSWNLSSADPWLTITPASGSGPATVTLTATTNPDGIVRSGKVTARYTYADGTPTQTLSVTQQGATLAVAPLAVDLPTGGPGADGKVSSLVTVSSNVSWYVSNAPAWLTVSPQAGTGDATLTLQVEANPSVDVRRDSVTLTAGTLTRKVAVTQAGLPVELRLGSTQIAFTQPGGTQPLALFCNTDWQLQEPSQLPAWLRASPTGGKGNASLTLSAGENPSLQARSCTLTFTARGESRSLAVSQEAARPFLSLSADTLLFVPAGESKSLDVTANMAWTISDLPTAEAWYRVTASGVTTGGGEGSGIIRITASENPDTSSRTARLTLSGEGLSRTLTLFQPGTPAYLTVPSDTVQLSAAGESKTVSLLSNLSWQVSGAASWLSVAPPTGKGSRQVALSAPANESAQPKNTTLTVTAGSFARTILVKQLAQVDSLPTALPAPAAGPGLVLAPNPAHHLLKLSIGQQSGLLLPVVLYNSLGQSVASYALPVVDNQVQATLPVGHLPRGLYVLQVHTATGLQRGKLLLQ